MHCINNRSHTNSMIMFINAMKDFSLGEVKIANVLSFSQNFPTVPHHWEPLLVHFIQRLVATTSRFLNFINS